MRLKVDVVSSPSRHGYRPTRTAAELDTYSKPEDITSLIERRRMRRRYNPSLLHYTGGKLKLK